MYNVNIARSSKGRTEDFESFNLGSIPSLAALPPFGRQGLRH